MKDLKMEAPLEMTGEVEMRQLDSAEMYMDEEDCQVKSYPVKKLLADLLKEVTAKTPQEAAGMKREDEIPSKVLAVVISEYVVKVAKKRKWDIVRFHGHYHFYNGEYWIKIESDEVKNFLGEVAERIGVAGLIARTFGFKNTLEKQFYETAYVNPPDPEENETLINLCNGTLVITKDDQRLKPFDKNDFIRYKLGFQYDPFAKAPIFQKYLDRVLPVKGKQEVLAEFIGYAFTRNKGLKLEKSLILYGSGANGKSLFHSIISAMLGNENISHVTLQDLTSSNGYSVPLLDGKLLNYASEISSKMDTTKFKTLVSGEPIQAREIFGRPYMMEDYARLIFNTNNLPTDIEHNEAFSRRLIIIDFDVTIPEAERNPDLAGYIIENELSGVMNWALDGLDRILKNKKFTTCPEIESALAMFKQESDSVRMFLDEKFYAPSTNENVPLQTFYKEYSLFCQENGYRPCMSKGFSNRLKTHGFEVQRKSEGRVVYVSIDKEKRKSFPNMEKQ